MRLWMAVVSTMMLVACGSGAVVSTETSPVTSSLPVASSTTIDHAGAGLAAAAVEDLAGRLGVASTEVELLDSGFVTWNDGSLGCPEPGVAYTQALVEGWQATLAHDGREYAYHAALDGEPFLCERPSTGTSATS